jgi:hypothetical protein
MQRRHFLRGSAALAGVSPLAALAVEPPVAPLAPAFAPPRALARVRATPDRIIDIATCTRPFREQGPRIEAERMHGKTVVHHYGHGGSGWSLSWGSAREALPLILATRASHIAVIGCGAIGLATARTAQRAGLRVRIYCKDRPPEVRSSAATGWWSPDSRIATEVNATPEFAARWERMARASDKTWQSMLGLPGTPVEWLDGYVLSDVPFDQDVPDNPVTTEPDYAELAGRIADLRPRPVLLLPGQHPFHAPHVRRFSTFLFNLSVVQKMLVDDFLREGGEIVHREFGSPRDLARLPERTIVNCTGFGARALLGDTSIVPVRGQTARLVPQPEVDYAIAWRGHNVVMVPRRDGLVVQAQGEHDYGVEAAAPDRASSEAAVRRLAEALA